jgi:hypothetical protein
VSLTGIDHIQLAAPPGCEPAARNFFGGLLELEEIPKPEALRARGGCWFKVGEKQLHIGIEHDFQPARKAHPAFSVENIERLYEKLSNGGVRCTWDDGVDDVRRFYASDPWGNRLEFTEPTRVWQTDRSSPTKCS